MPIVSAAIGWSRIAISARPGAAVEQVARDPEHDDGDRQHHQEHPLVGGERQVERCLDPVELKACTPPVIPSMCRYFSICGTAIASAKVASAR